MHAAHISILNVILSFAFSFLSLTAHADELTLYLYPTAKGLDFSTPRSLMQTTLKNEAAGDSHSIGHLNVEINCAATATRDAVSVLTGMTSASSKEARQLLLQERYGYGILFHNFAGRLYTAEEINTDLKGRFANGTVSFMRWTISADTCSRVAQYFAEYVQRGYENTYGLPNRPRFGEGAGCSAFGMSFLEIAGLMDDVYTNNWQRFLRIPERYVGGP